MKIARIVHSYNPEKINECDFDYENIVICSVLQKKMKTEIREAKKYESKI